MHPEPLILNLLFFTVQISFYRLFFIIALITSITVNLWLIKKSQLEQKPAIITLIASVFFFLIGARLYNAILRPELYFKEPARLLSLDANGLSLYGGLIFAALAVYLGSRLFKFDIWKFTDAITPGLGFGIFLMRFGCFLNGCCFGKETNMPWGINYPLMSQAHLWQISHKLTGIFSILPVHPTQLYEAVYALISSGLAMYLLFKKYPSGIPTVSFLLIFTIFRLGNHFLRALPYNETVVYFFYPLFYLAIIISCIIVLHKLLLKKHEYRSRST